MHTHIHILVSSCFCFIWVPDLEDNIIYTQGVNLFKLITKTSYQTIFKEVIKCH